MATRVSFGRRRDAGPAGPAVPEAAQGLHEVTPLQSGEDPGRDAAHKAHSARIAAVARVAAQIHPLVVQALDVKSIAEVDRAVLQRQVRDWLEQEGGRNARVPQLGPVERQQVAKQLVDEIKGLGPLEVLMADTEVSDILVNGMSSAFVERKGRLEPVVLHFRDEAHLLEVAQRIAGRIGRRVDEASPMVDARLEDGSRVNIVIPPLALDGTTISIRRFVVREISLRQMASSGAMSMGMAQALEIAVRAKLNILVSGGTGAGKTTLMNAMSREIPGGERLITIEDAAELQLMQPHVVRLETRTEGAEQQGGGVDMKALLVNTLRMRPDRIIVGR